MFQITLQSIKYLFKNKLLTLFIILFPLICSAGLSFGLQTSLLPSIKNLINNKGKEQVSELSKLAQKSTKDFKVNQPKLHQNLESFLKDQFIESKTDKLAETAVFHFTQTLLPSYYELAGKKLTKILQRTNTILLILLAISVLPPLISVFLISQEKQTGTLESVLAQGLSSQKFILGKIGAALLINLFIIAIIVIGYAIGSYLSTTDPKLFKLVFNKTTIQSILTIGIAGSLATLSFMFLICTIIKEFKAQIFVAFLVPLISIGAFFILTASALSSSSADDLNQSTQTIKITRPIINSKAFKYRTEPQIYGQASIVAKLLAEEEIPDQILAIAFPLGYKSRQKDLTKIKQLGRQIAKIKSLINQNQGRDVDYAKNDAWMAEIAVLKKSIEAVSKRVIRVDPKAKSFLDIIQCAALWFLGAAFIFICSTLLLSFRIRI